MASIDELYIKILADGSQLSTGLNQAQSKLDGFSSFVSKMGGVMAGAFSVVAIERFVSMTMEAYDASERAQAKVAQAIKTTGGVANMSLKELTETAADFQKSTLFEDDTILNDVTAQLLTFTNIAGTNFLRAQEAAMNLATVLDGDLKGASIQLGKALNDPVKGMMALSRSGIQFSADQTAVIKNLAETNRLSEAQTLILDELQRQYGGQAKAAAEASNGITQFKNALGDAWEQIGKAIATSDTFKNGLNEMTDILYTWSNSNIGTWKAIGITLDKALWGSHGSAFLAQQRAMEKAISDYDKLVAPAYKDPSSKGKSDKKNTTLADLKQELADLQLSQESATSSTIAGINQAIEAKKAEIKKWEDSGVAVNNYKGSIKGLQIELDALSKKRDTAVGADNIAVISDQIRKKEEEIDVLKRATSEWVAYGKSMASAIKTMTAIPAKLPEPKKPEIQSNDELQKEARRKTEKEYKESIFDINSFNEQMGNAITDGLANMMGSMTEALVTGGDIGKAMLGSMGSLLTQLGTMMLKAGLGMLGLKLSLKTLNPAIAIAAGVGLIAIGAMFSNGAKSLGNSMGGGGGGYGSSGSNEYDTRTRTADTYRNQQITFRVQGRDLVAVTNANDIYYNRKG